MGVYMFLDWLDHHHTQFQMAACMVSGISFFVLIWVHGYRKGRRRWYGAVKKSVEYNNTVCEYARTILKVNMGDKHKLRTLNKLFTKEDK